MRCSSQYPWSQSLQAIARLKTNETRSMLPYGPLRSEEDFTKFVDQELISYRYSACACCSFGVTSSKNP